MSTFVYGVFTSTDAFSSALTDLKILGMSDPVIVRNTENESYTSATLAPLKKTPFIAAGAIGAIIGGLAGAIATPSLQVQNSFQVITPMMTMVSGGIVCAYFAVWLAGFLYWIDRPVLEHEVFEGNIANGAVLIGVTVAGSEEKLKAIECFDRNGAEEIIARTCALESAQVQDVEAEVLEELPKFKVAA